TDRHTLTFISRPYLVIGAARSASLNISVLNRGDDAYDTHLFISFPKELYFVKVQQVMRMLLLNIAKHLSVLFLFISACQRNFSVILDTTLLGEEDPLLSFSLLAQRSVRMFLINCFPHLGRFTSVCADSRWVSPPSFVYGEEGTNISQFEQIPHAHCLYQWMNFSFQVVNLGPSPVPGALFELLIPNRLSQDGPEIFHIQQAVVEFGNGHCIARVPSQLCLVPHDQESIFRTLFSIFTKSGRKILVGFKSPLRFRQCRHFFLLLLYFIIFLFFAPVQVNFCPFVLVFHCHDCPVIV
uniref:Integrin alpha second immunoglobulin-like domain-containing protein n=1 Tax=Eptatretus burgeri TaxID=7764 RepID=A0A8C4N745_EPTBU